MLQALVDQQRLDELSRPIYESTKGTTTKEKTAALKGNKRASYLISYKKNAPISDCWNLGFKDKCRDGHTSMLAFLFL